MTPIASPRPLARLLLVLCGILLRAGAAHAGPLADPAAELAPLVAAGGDLLAEADAMQRQAPRTEAEVDAMIPTAWRKWTLDQQAFQERVYLLLDHYRELAPAGRDGVTQLVRLNNLAVNAVTAMTLCNAEESAWDLAAAAQVLEQARSDAAGRAAPDRPAALRPDPKTPGGCR